MNVSADRERLYEREFISESEKQEECEFSVDRSGTLFSSSSSFSFNLQLYIENNQFFFFFFYVFSRKKNRVNAVIVLFMDDTLDEEDFLLSWKNKTQPCQSRSLVNNFSSKFFVNEWPTASLPPALHVTDNYACGL